MPSLSLAYQLMAKRAHLIQLLQHKAWLDTLLQNEGIRIFHLMRSDTREQVKVEIKGDIDIQIEMEREWLEHAGATPDEIATIYKEANALNNCSVTATSSLSV